MRYVKIAVWFILIGIASVAVSGCHDPSMNIKDSVEEAGEDLSWVLFDSKE